MKTKILGLTLLMASISTANAAGSVAECDFKVNAAYNIMMYRQFGLNSIGLDHFTTQWAKFQQQIKIIQSSNKPLYFWYVRAVKLTNIVPVRSVNNMYAGRFNEVANFKLQVGLACIN